MVISLNHHFKILCENFIQNSLGKVAQWDDPSLRIGRLSIQIPDALGLVFGPNVMTRIPVICQLK